MSVGGWLGGWVGVVSLVGECFCLWEVALFFSLGQCFAFSATLRVRVRPRPALAKFEYEPRHLYAASRTGVLL